MFSPPNSASRTETEKYASLLCHVNKQNVFGRGNDICWISTKTIVPCAVSLWNTFIYKMMIIQQWKHEARSQLFIPFAENDPAWSNRQSDEVNRSLGGFKDAKRARRSGKIKRGEKGVFFFLQVSKSHSFSLGLQGLAHTTEKLTNEATILGKPPENSQASILQLISSCFKGVPADNGHPWPMFSFGQANKGHFNEVLCSWLLFFKCCPFKHIRS